MTKGQIFIIDKLELGMKRTVFSLIILATAGLISLYYYSTQINKPKYALGLDPTKDTTDMAGIQYRVRVNNVGLNQTYFFSPKPDTNITTVQISTNEGIVVQGDYRSPTKVLGLPGSGR